MWDADLIGHNGNTNFNRAYQGSELVWEKQHHTGPADNQVWYSTNNNEVEGMEGFRPGAVISNIYSNNIGKAAFSENITSLASWAYWNNTTLTMIYFPSTLVSIGERAFFGASISECYFNGSIAQWNNVTQGNKWNYISTFRKNITVVHCTDGDVPI